MIEIKTAELSDAPLLAALAKEIWTQHYMSIISIEQINFMLHSFQSAEAIVRDLESGAIYDTAYLDGEPCGYSATKPDDTGLFLSKLYVKQSCRGQGVARALMTRIDERAKGAGAGRIWLKCNKHNKHSLAAYKRLGFSIAYPCITDIGGGFVMDDYALEKTV
jgi:ribosomal protein S18 acetylase RimI-like enzyme